MLEARKYPGGDDPALVGLAMGMYGLTQAFFQLPLGMASDRFGRKRVIVLGLAVFAAGSLAAALADSVMGLLVGRALQGAGAVSAAVTAPAGGSDARRRAHQGHGPGISIGLMFAMPLVLAPLLTAHIGLSGLFTLTFALALAGVALIVWVNLPPETRRHADLPQGRLADVWRHADLRRLNLGVFALHTPFKWPWGPCPALVQAG